MQAKLNIKSLNKEQRHGIRLAAHSMWTGGLKAPAISKQTGVNLSTVSRWTSSFASAPGRQPAPEKPRGPKPGSNAALNAAQSADVRRTITDKTPDQLKFPFALWDSVAVRELVLRRFGIALGARALRRYLRRWGFTPQRPVRVARERDDAAVNRWLGVEYPAIKRKAKREKAVVYWADETGVSACEHRPRGYAPRGRKPVVRTLANKGCKINLISAVSNTGKARFMISDKAVDAVVFRGFLARLIRGCDMPVFLIVDNLKVHHAKVLKPWLEKNRKKLRLFFLPGYSPDLNPDEYLNQDLKRAVNKLPGAENKTRLGQNVRSHMKKRVKQPHVVRGFFQHPKVKYAMQ